MPELPKNLFRREGEYWTVSYDGSVVRLRDAKGQLGAGLIDLLLRYQRPRSGHVAWRELVASLAGELDPVQATAGTLEQYRHVDAQVLLMYGSETDPMFVDCAEALHAVLPHSTVLGLPGLNHDSAQTYGKPEMIAASLRLFLCNKWPDRPGPHLGTSSRRVRAVRDIPMSNRPDSRMVASMPIAERRILPVVATHGFLR